MQTNSPQTREEQTSAVLQNTFLMEFQRIHTLEKVEEVKVVSLLSACSSRKLSHG